MSDTSGLYIPNEGVINAFKEVNDIGYIPTEETKYDDLYEQTLVKAYIPVYIVEGFYAENTNPNIDEYPNIDFALSNMEVRPNDYGDGGNYFEPYNDLLVEFNSVWLDEDGEIVEEIENGLTNEDIDDCPLIQQILGKYRESIANYTFTSKGDIRVDTQFELSNRVTEIYSGKEYNFSGHIVYLNADSAFYGKYTDIEVIDKETGEIVGYIKCRFADHSYNPANNTEEGAFISVVVNSNDPTENKYHGMYNLRYDDEPNVEDILDDFDERIEEIMYDGSFLTTDGAELYGI